MPPLGTLPEVSPGIHLVPIPMRGPLREVNCYLCRGSDGWTIVDTGFHTEATEAAWRAAFASCGIGPRDVERIVVTHFHPDHFGAAGWLQSITGAPVLMLDREIPQVEDVWGRPREHGERELGLFVRHGMPPDQLARLKAYYERHERDVLPLPEVTPVREGEAVAIGGASYRPIWAPGHAPGLMVLLRESDGLLFVDDMVLAGITPNVSQREDDRGSPLRPFLASLDAMAALDARLALPGHRELIPDLAGRAREIRAHHRERLERVVQLVRAGGGPQSGWQVSLGLFGPQVTVANARFAVAEAVAHLEYLAEEGVLRREAADGAVYYLAP